MTINEKEHQDLIQKHKFYKVPKDCSKNQCNYICNKFATPYGINIDEIMNTESLLIKEQELKDIFTLHKELTEYQEDNPNAVELY